MQVMAAATADSAELAVVIAVAVAEQADTPVQVATVVMVVVLHMPELQGQVVPAVAAVLHCFVILQVLAEVLGFKVKEEMVAQDQQVHLLETVVAEEEAPVAAQV
jgi:hypothetical protein